jgi:RNA polymerase sigma-70 factor, ECF subfamily
MAYGIDASLMERAVSGDRAAMNSIVTTLSPHVEKQLQRYPVSDEDRRDLLQCTLVQVVRRLGSFRGDSSFSTWLFRVTANEALMMMRSQRRLRARVTFGHDLDDLAAISATSMRTRTGGSDDALADRESSKVVRAAVETLPRDYRDVVVAHYTEDLGLQEIAERMRLSESAVRSRLHRARSKLRAELGSTDVGREAAASLSASAAA